VAGRGRRAARYAGQQAVGWTAAHVAVEVS
jgi:hypothetical protein